eukprot:jgi/Tetstr1/454021/TSEL_040940.t1
MRARKPPARKPELPRRLGEGARTSLTRRGYGIAKAGLDDGVEDAIRRYLTVSPAVNSMVSQAGPPPRYPVYQESRSKLYIPKSLGLSVYGAPGEDRGPPGEPLACGFAGDLRETQRAPVAAFLEAARDPLRRGGIINMACAAGKTVMGIHIACELGLKTLVLVHKEFLARQWQERIEQFAPGARVGRIQGKAFDVEGRDIVIAMVQTMAVRDFDEDAFDGFGTVIVDECHHMSAEVFSRALHRVNFRHSLGLSATLQRPDGLSHVFQWFLGGVVYRTRRPREEVEVALREFRSDDPRYCQELFVFGQQLNMARMISNVCGFAPRTDAVAGWILDSLAERPGSRVLVLSERRSHLREMDDAVRARDATVTTGFYVGGMKQEDLKASESRRVVFGTFAMASEGMDIPALDTLVLASPKSEIEQPVGRILRVRADKRERVPRVIDVVDAFSVFRAQAAKRQRYYQKCGYRLAG